MEVRFFSVESSFFVVYYYFFSKTNVLTPFSGLFYPSLCVRPVIIEKFGRNCTEEFSGNIFFSFFFQNFLEKSYAQFSVFLYRRLLVKRKHLCQHGYLFFFQLLTDGVINLPSFLLAQEDLLHLESPEKSKGKQQFAIW